MKGEGMKKFREVLAVVLLIAALCFIFWLETCGLIYLFCVLFDLRFSLAIATGIWVFFLVIAIALFHCKGE